MIHAKTITIRSKKEDSAFIYHILESHEGLTAYRTLDHIPHEQTRDVELIFSAESLADVRSLLKELAHLVVILDDSN